MNEKREIPSTEAKPRYETPVVIPLGGIPLGHGKACPNGSAAGTNCVTGGGASGNQCKTGSTASGGRCNPGGTAATGCNAGTTAAGVS